jgi:hypothetical protein
LVNMPNWLGAIDIGPVRLNAYSRAMRALPRGELTSVLSVAAPYTLNTVRICR